MVKKQTDKPMFEVKRGVTPVDVKDADGSILTFNAQPVGPRNYAQLREETYGPEGFGFEQATFGQSIPLVYGARMTDTPTEESKRVLSVLRRYWISGKTLALPGQEGLFVDDDPDLSLIGNRGEYEQALQAKLGSREADGVFHSSDGLVRFTPYGFQVNEQNALSFSKNRGLIALVGNRERADMLAEVASKYAFKPWLGELFKNSEAGVRVPDVSDYDFYGRLVVGSGDLGFVDGYSFGVRRSAEGAHAEKSNRFVK